MNTWAVAAIHATLLADALGDEVVPSRVKAAIKVTKANIAALRKAALLLNAIAAQQPEGL